MKKIIVTLAATLFATTAFAQAPEFSAIDADANGTLSVEEIKAALPDIDDAALAAADTDQDGAISESEYQALVASLQQ